MRDLYHSLFNTSLYTFPEIVVYWIGFALWAYAYFILVFSMRREKFVDMPFIVASGNVAWEALWAFVFVPDMGPLLMWLYRIGFLTDCYIFYYVFQYGHRQISGELKTIEQQKNPTPSPAWFKPTLIAITIAWLVIFYLYKSEGWDNPMGTFSALQLNLVISPMCIMMLRSNPSLYGMSYTVAWLKMLGTGLVTVFMFMHFPDKHFLQFVGVCIFIIDNTYIYLFAQRRKAIAAEKMGTAGAQLQPAMA